MSSLEQFRASSAWDKRYDLPLCPGNNNPWIYMAYAEMVMNRADGSKLDRDKIGQHFVKCRANNRPGLFNRWPDGTGGMNSHDEIMGAAFFAPWIAEQIYTYLQGTCGDFNNTGEKPARWLQFNVYRMVFLRPYLRACMMRDVSYFDQLVWSAHMFVDARNRKADDCGGALRNWLMCEKMARFPLCAKAIAYWKKTVQQVQTPKQCLSVEPREHPIFGELAPEIW